MRRVIATGYYVAGFAGRSGGDKNGVAFSLISAGMCLAAHSRLRCALLVLLTNCRLICHDFTHIAERLGLRRLHDIKKLALAANKPEDGGHITEWLCS